jgi:hypothetical protein
MSIPSITVMATTSVHADFTPRAAAAPGAKVLNCSRAGDG